MMDYSRIYQQLIDFRKANPASGYTENHHILPRSMGGSDDQSNLVKLTGREHWIAHLLLWRIYANQQCAHACHTMAMRCEERGIPQVRNSRMYEAIRMHHAKLMSSRMAAFAGEKNSQFGTRWICNPTLKANKKIDKFEEIPQGWVSGRNVWKTLEPRSYPEKVCPKCSKVFSKRGTFCSKKCSNSRPMSEEQKIKLSNSLSGVPRPYRVGLKHKNRSVA